MDRALTPQVMKTRRLRKAGKGLLLALVAAAGLLLLRELISPSLSRAEIRTAIVERGEVSTVVSASGVVVPKHERVVVSPLSSSVMEVYSRVGDAVTPHDAILRLDASRVDREIERLEDELRLKELEVNNLVQDRERQVRQLESQRELLAIDLQSQEINLERYETLFQSKTVSKYDFDAARLAVEKTRVQLRQLAQEVRDIAELSENALAQLEVQKRLLRQQLAEQRRLREESVVKAGVAGIITVLADELGQSVPEGSELVRVSDLSSFRIDAALSDYYLQEIRPGMTALINLGGEPVEGRVEQILPSVENDTLRLQVELENPRLPRLKPNLRVEVELITRQAAASLRVSNGSVFNGPGRHEVFVIDGGFAVKRAVEVGLVNTRQVEILSGLREGEEIIISGAEDYGHLESIAVN